MDEHVKFDVYDNLAVRVCKGGKPTLKKLKRIYSLRSFVNLEDVSTYAIAYYLLSIIEDYKLIPPHSMNRFIVYNCSPDNQKYMHNLGVEETGNADEDHSIRIVRACCSCIRLSEVAKFEVNGGKYRIPLKFKNSK